MWQRDKLFQKYYKETNLERKELLHVKYKSLRNELTKKKRDSKTNYYQVYFVNNSKKSISYMERDPNGSENKILFQ